MKNEEETQPKWSLNVKVDTNALFVAVREANAGTRGKERGLR